jgi:predicted lipid-binding transport protein (Tim44 family)
MGVRERITASLTEIRSRSQKLVQLNVELLTAELKKKAQKYGGAIGMLVAGGLLAPYALGFALATITVALALVLPLWLALLIVTLALILIIAVLILAGRSTLQKIKSAAPGQAGAEAKATAATVKAGAAKAAGSLRPTRPAGPAAAPETLETPEPAESPREDPPSEVSRS